MPHSNPVLTFIFCSSSGTHLLAHLPSDGTGLAGGQVAVVAIGQVDADHQAGCILKRSIASRAWGMLIWLLLALLIFILSL